MAKNGDSREIPMAVPAHGRGKLRVGGVNPGAGRPRKEVAEARRVAAEAAAFTVEGHMAKLEELRDLAIKLENPTAAVNAEVKRGEIAGFYVKRREDVTRLTPEERAERAAKILKLA